MGQLQYQPRLSHVLHPGADEGHELSGPEQPEVPVAQGAEEGFCNGCFLHGLLELTDTVYHGDV